MDRWYDPRGDQKGMIDIRRCQSCADGLDPERAADRKKYARNKVAEARRAIGRPRKV